MAKKRKRTKIVEADTVVARSFQLVDDKDRVRAFILSSDTSVHFNLCDENGNPRLSISLDPKGEPHITLLGAKAEPALAMGVTNDGHAGISITNVNSPSEGMRIGIQDLGNPNFDSKLHARILITGPKGDLLFAIPELPPPSRTNK